MEPTGNKAFFSFFLNAVQTGVVVADDGRNVVAANQEALDMLGRPKNTANGAGTCHELLFKESKPCPDCPFENGGEKCPQPKSLAIKRERGGDTLVKVKFACFDGNCVLTLSDVTKEVNLLRKVDHTRKELQAKNIILERRQQEMQLEFQFLSGLFDQLPEAVMTVNDNYSVMTKNASVGAILGSEKGEKCYEFVGNDFPCENCPAEKGFDFYEEQKKSHTINGKCITEIIKKSQKGGLLLFRDTTRQIELITKIREQQDAITKRNSILNGLVGFGAQMHKETETIAVIDFFMDIFLPVIKSKASALIVDDVRPGSLWFTTKVGLSDEELKILTRAYLSREMQSSSKALMPPESFPWQKATQVPLIGGNGRRVGILVLQGEYMAQEEDFDLIPLFTEPLGAYIHNKLLMRQLEEKANTDSLTSLYNRNYFDQALEEETSKFKKYGIHFSVVVVDVNRLKMANDVYGHEAGDKLILTVSKLLASHVRSTDIVARTGGDEFIVLLTNSGDESANAFIKRMKDYVFHEVFMAVGEGEQFPVTVSLGAAGTDKVSLEDLIKEADRRMYADKEEYYKTHQRYR